MTKILKIIVLLIPYLVFVDIKIPAGSLNIGLKDLLMVLMFCILILQMGWNILYNCFKNKIILFYLIFAVLTFVNNILLSNFSNAFPELLRIFEGLILMLGIEYVLKYYEAFIIYQSIIFSCAILSLQVIFGKYLGFGISDTLGGIAGMWLGVGIVTLYFNYRQLKLHFSIKLFLFLIFFLSLYILQKRTWLALTLFILFIDYFRALSYNKIFFVILGMLFSVAIYNEVISDERMRAFIDLITKLDFSALSSRLYRWGTAGVQISNHWFLGVGYEHIDLQLKEWIKTDNPDNEYIELWLQNGLLPLLSFFVILIIGIKTKVKDSLYDTLLIKNAFLLVSIGGVTWGFMHGYGAILFSILIGLSASATTNNKEEEYDEDQDQVDENILALEIQPL